MREKNNEKKSICLAFGLRERGRPGGLKGQKYESRQLRDGSSVPSREIDKKETRPKPNYLSYGNIRYGVYITFFGDSGGILQDMVLPGSP